MWPRRDSNTQPSDLESDVLPLRHGVNLVQPRWVPTLITALFCRMFPQINLMENLYFTNMILPYLRINKHFSPAPHFNCIYSWCLHLNKLKNSFCKERKREKYCFFAFKSLALHFKAKTAYSKTGISQLETSEKVGKIYLVNQNVRPPSLSHTFAETPCHRNYLNNYIVGAKPRPAPQIKRNCCNNIQSTFESLSNRPWFYERHTVTEWVSVSECRVSEWVSGATDERKKLFRCGNYREVLHFTGIRLMTEWLRPVK